MNMKEWQNLATFEAIMFIAPYRKQPLVKYWCVKGSPTIFHVFNYHNLWQLRKI